MPGKHVRFDDIPPTPPSLYSYQSSLPSEGAPITPPPLNHYGSPHACSPLPPVASRIHPLLSATRAPLVHHDLTLPSTALQLHPTVPPQALNEPATQPPLPFMTIVCTHLPWSITVSPANSKHGAYVTVMDVFDALYRVLRASVTSIEFEKIPTDEQRKVDDAYRRRYKLFKDQKGYELEKSKGLKRVDFLKERHMFTGLSSTPRGPEVWELVVS